MTDLKKTFELLDKYAIAHHTTPIYDEDNCCCGYAIWFLNHNGHLEFDLNGKLTNIIKY